MVKALIVDCLGCGKGKRYATIDVIGVGPRAVAGVLESKNIKYTLITSEDLLKHPRVMEDYDILLTSAMISDIVCAKNIALLWKKISNGIALLGGPITAKPRLVAELGYDIGVLGEGEYVLDKLFSRGIVHKDAEDLIELVNKLSGLIINIKGKVYSTGVAKYLTHEQLNRYKPSTRAIKYYPIYWASRVYVEVVRGCSNFYRTTIMLPDGRKCTNCNICRRGDLEERLRCPISIPPGCGYCSVPMLYGPPRSKLIDNIVNEIRDLIKIGVNRIVLSAPDFLDYGRDLIVYPKPLTNPRIPPANIELIEELLGRLHEIPEIASREVSLMIENIKPNLLTEKVARILGKYLKNTTVHLGVETGDPEHCKILGRPNTVDEAIKAVKLLVKYGLRPYVYFIHGLPGQSPTTINNTIKVMDIMFNLGAEKITIYRFRPLPLSAFEGFPPSPPAIENELSKKLYLKARELNIKAKKRMIGKVFKAIVVSTYPPNKNFMVTYPLNHGPVILVPRGSNVRKKSLVEVIVREVINDRLVKGEIIKLIRKLSVQPF